MTSRPAFPLVLSGVLAVLAAGCASSGGAAAAAAPAPSAACASAATPPDDARLAAAFDSLHTLAMRGRAPGELVLAPHDRKPRIDNAGEVRNLLATLYPPALRDAKIGGTTRMALLVDASGTVRNVLLVRGSAHDELDRASIAVARSLRFRPARQGSCPVPFFMVIPITWTIEESR